MAKKAVSDGYLDTLWSAAVKRDRRCAKCGMTGDSLHAHHIIKRRYKVLRWDVKNGIALCPACHEWIHSTPKGKQWEVEHADLEYLDDKHCNLKDYLLQCGMSDAEFRTHMKESLKAVVDGNI